MIVTCWSVKGGSGTSVVVAGLAAAWSRERPILAVDLAGDLPAVLGMPAPPGPGVEDWLRAGTGVGAAALEALAVEARPGLRVIHRNAPDEPALPGGAHLGCRAGDGVTDGRWRDLRSALEAVHDDVVIDAGTALLPEEIAAMSHASLLVLRPCFLALRQVSRTASAAPTGVVVVSEPGRALGRRDIEQVVGVRIAAEVHADPAVARAVDAGLLASRLPGSLAQLARTVDRWADRAAVRRPSEHERGGWDTASMAEIATGQDGAR